MTTAWSGTGRKVLWQLRSSDSGRDRTGGTRTPETTQRWCGSGAMPYEKAEHGMTGRGTTRKRIFEIVGRTVAGLIAAGAMSPGLVHGAAGTEVELDVAIHADLKNIDPIWTTALITSNHGYAIYDTLFGTDADFQPQPQMAEGYTLSDDGRVYTITLRDGLAWHDGSPVSARDCVASINRWGKRDALGQVLMGKTKSLEAADERTIVLTLNEPWAMTTTALGKMNANVPFMMPERVALTDAHEQLKEMVGSGPFRILKDEWVPGSKVVYEKNEAYVPRGEPASMTAGGKNVHFDRVVWHYIPDSQTAANALIVGEIDLIENVAADLVPVLDAAEGVTVEPTDTLGWQPWLVINHLHPPFDNVKARQAPPAHGGPGHLPAGEQLDTGVLADLSRVLLLRNALRERPRVGAADEAGSRGGEAAARRVRIRRRADRPASPDRHSAAPFREPRERPAPAADRHQRG